ncbi:uncharacterized protein LOC130934834 [Arachis stenosperma]|uniref:uncharacterized protein LOC130934834 n=1 Tax=Arachis stenosperma TaxID=217475 RepID=UPI0025AD7B3A|nr:uncharacterized protein LOC130934834 [Arachis stenosperma]
MVATMAEAINNMASHLSSCIPSTPIDKCGGSTKEHSDGVNLKFQGEEDELKQEVQQGEGVETIEPKRVVGDLGDVRSPWECRIREPSPKKFDIDVEEGVGPPKHIIVRDIEERNHPNFGWENQQDQSQDQRRYNSNNNAAHQQFTQGTYQHPHNNTSPHPYQNQNNTSTPNPPSFDDKLSKIEALLEGICQEIQENKVFKEEVQANIKNQGETIKKLEFQVGCLAEKFPKPTDSFPSDTEKNPRGEAKKVRWEDCKMVTTSDQEDEDKQSKLSQQPEDNSTEEEDRDHQEPEISQQELLKLYAPFPQLLNGAVGKRIYSRFLDLFASLYVNIPFIKAIQQMPAFIKYMKEFLPRKSSLKGGQTIVLNKECSALIQPELPAKRKDPGSFHIPCAIGETIFDRALCDLGASINLLPLSLVKRL